jgi:hypothetical protein
MTSFTSADTIKQSMAASLRQTIRRITKDPDGLREILNNHYLKGTFVQLCNPQQMKELLYPGASAEVLQNLPKTLREVLQWSDLDLDMEKIARNGAEVLRNIKIKGAKQGNIMDEATERVLLPQIAQEALSKGVIEAVRKLNLKVSGTIAKIARAVAAPDHERAHKNGLDDDVIECYLNHRFAVQREYVGNDWCDVIRNDMRRFLSHEKLSLIDENGEVFVKDISTRVEELIPHSSMAWIEKDDRIQEIYPALFELIDQMQSLPYELNGRFNYGKTSHDKTHTSILSARCNFRNLNLLEPGKGCTMFVHFPAGSSQKIRLDNRGGEFDSGIR